MSLVLPVKERLPADELALLGHFRQLGPQDRSTLLAFAEFLTARCGPQKPSTPQPPLQAIVIERPAEESVIGAIKRLSHSYPMLDRSKMLNETSLLMSAHLLQGRAAAEVIDDLEALFHQHYQQYLGHTP